MPKSTLTWYKSRANEIMKDIRLLKNKDAAVLLNVSPQTMSYRTKNIYPKELQDIIRLLDMAGYQIVEKEYAE